ncbi:hypothetical protein ETAA8_25630 [Anatilimnocola aggregata]|uniref:Uncharacterized protein n=1 Tax=Anatilimnocola aggregata TaxID=2528021 RepID=A0A517YB63_9BACT|nr:hypothetical protein ETAA8_25630 [Anatilimnocola aggregata]
MESVMRKKRKAREEWSPTTVNLRCGANVVEVLFPRGLEFIRCQEFLHAVRVRTFGHVGSVQNMLTSLRELALTFGRRVKVRLLSRAAAG